LVKKEFASRYAGVSNGTIRRRLQDARNPAINSILGAILGARPLDPRGMKAEERRAHVIDLISEQWISD
jgi:hypothetical protein